MGVGINSSQPSFPDALLFSQHRAYFLVIPFVDMKFDIFSSDWDFCRLVYRRVPRILEVFIDQVDAFRIEFLISIFIILFDNSE